MTNWCWWEGWFKFKLLKDYIKNVKYFNPDKIESLYKTIETRACGPHDNKFTLWGWIKEFLKANYDFTIELLRILHWTSVWSRIIIFTITMLWLNTIWIRYFNWTRIF